MQDAIPDTTQKFVSYVLVVERSAKGREAEEFTELLICT